MPPDEAARVAETLHASCPESAIGAAALGAALLRAKTSRSGGGGGSDRGGGRGGEGSGGGDDATKASASSKDETQHSSAEEGQSLLETALARDKGCLTALVELAELCARTREDQKCIELATAAEAEITAR